MRDGILLLMGALTAVVITGCTSVPGNDETATNVSVVTGFDTARRIGTTTGVSEATVCEGWYPATPNHVLLIDDSLAMTVRGTSDDDLRIRLVGGQSSFCSTGATAQEYSRFWTKGTVEVYVGTLEEGKTIDYVLEFQEN